MKSQSKANAKKKSKTNDNPEHPAFIAAIKGFTSAIIDFDYMVFENGTVLTVIAEQDSLVKAVLMKSMGKESEYIQSTLKLQAGQTILSVSIGPLSVTNSRNFSLLLAVAIFDHCSVVFYELHFKNNELSFIN